MATILINPTQLFKTIVFSHLNIKKVIIYEEPKLMTRFKYHKQKLILHRASAKWYANFLQGKNYNVLYLEYHQRPPKVDYIIEPFDFELEKKYKGAKILESPNFLISKNIIAQNPSIFNDKMTHDKFYRWQRRRLNVLMKGKEPQGGKWNFDTENRKKIPSNEKVPKINWKCKENKYIAEAKKYIEKHFANNPGETIFSWPITHKDAQEWLNEFISNRLSKFGPYQDASRIGENILYHSALTPMLNIGLITDKDVLEKTCKAKCPLQSKEAFIRQLIGWRNYMLAWYILDSEGLKKNYWNHRSKLSKEWWNFDPINIAPIDNILVKIKDSGFVHHIERLMYLGVWMFLSHIDPNQVYEWFMIATIDAYEWVMVPNIYGMSQHADGGKVMRRPYICSSNYILKMSNNKRDKWCQVWDNMYWKFIQKNIAYFSKSYYYGTQVAILKKKLVSNLE